MKTLTEMAQGLIGQNKPLPAIADAVSTIPCRRPIWREACR